MGLPEKHQRPGGESEALTESFDGDIPTIAQTSDASEEVARCVRCHRPLTSPSAVSAGMGWRCQRRHDADTPAPTGLNEITLDTTDGRQLKVSRWLVDGDEVIRLNIVTDPDNPEDYFFDDEIDIYTNAPALELFASALFAAAQRARSEAIA